MLQILCRECYIDLRDPGMIVDCTNYAQCPIDLRDIYNHAGCNIITLLECGEHNCV
jgi:hypothetical protein